MVDPQVFLNSMCKRETPCAHVDTVDVRTWSFTFTHGVLRANVKLQNFTRKCETPHSHVNRVYVRTWSFTFAHEVKKNLLT